MFLFLFTAELPYLFKTNLATFCFDSSQLEKQNIFRSFHLQNSVASYNIIKNAS